MTATETKPTRKPRASANAPTSAPEQAPLTTLATVVAIPRARIHPGKFQNRDLFEQQRLEELADSIRANGIRVPLAVRDDGDGTYSLIAGERRWRAAALAGLDEVPCIVEAIGDLEHATTTVLENLQREDLTAVEEARGFATLRDIGGLDAETIAKKVGRQPDYIKDSLRLLDLPERVLGLLHQGASLAGKDGQPDGPPLKLSRSQGLALLKDHTPERAALTVAVAEHALVRGVAATGLADAEKRLNVYDDVARRLAPKEALTPAIMAALPIYAIPYGSPVLQSNCFNCPFADYRGEKPNTYGRHYCLRPAHYLELLDRKRRDDAAEVAQAQAAAAAAIATAAEVGGASGIRPLASYPSGSYVRFAADGSASDKAAACTQGCPCRVIASDGKGEPVSICCDPARFKKLKGSETRAVNKDRRADAQVRTAQLANELDRVAAMPEGFSERELRIVALAAVGSLTSDAKKIEAAGRHILPFLGGKDLFGNGQSYSPNLLSKVGAKTLDAVPTPNLVRFAAEALARKELVEYAEYGQFGRVAAAYKPLAAPVELGEGEGESAPAPAPSASVATPAYPADEQALADRFVNATALIEATLWVSSAAVILLEIANPAGTAYAAFDADARAIAPHQEREGPLAQVAGYDYLTVTGPNLGTLIDACKADGETVVIFPLLGFPVVHDGAGQTVIAPGGQSPYDDPVVSFDPEDPAIAEAWERLGWAYQVLADNGEDPGSVVVLHQCDDGRLIAFGEDANYLGADFGYQLEEGPDETTVGMVMAGDAEDIIAAIVNRDGFTLVLVPREGPSVTTMRPGEGDNEQADAVAEDAGESLEEGLAALEALGR